MKSNVTKCEFLQALLTEPLIAGVLTHSMRIPSTTLAECSDLRVCAISAVLKSKIWEGTTRCVFQQITSGSEVYGSRGESITGDIMREFDQTAYACDAFNLEPMAARWRVIAAVEAVLPEEVVIRY